MFKYKVIVAMISIISATPTFAVSLHDVMDTNYLESGKTPYTQLSELYDLGRKPELDTEDRPGYSGLCFPKEYSDRFPDKEAFLLLEQIDLYGPGPSFPVTGTGVLSHIFEYIGYKNDGWLDSYNLRYFSVSVFKEDKKFAFAQDDSLVVRSEIYPNFIDYSVRSFGDFFVVKIFADGAKEARKLCYFNKSNSPIPEDQAGKEIGPLTK